MSRLPDEVSPAVRALNPHIFGSPMMTVSSAEEAIRLRRQDKTERELQKSCEQWLTLHDYRRLTADEATRDGIPAGWFGHMNRAEGNPLMPDLFIFSADGRRCLLVELKVRPQYQPGQKAMISLHGWELVETVAGFAALLSAWEMDNKEDGR